LVYTFFMSELIDIFDENWNPTGEVLEKDVAESLGKWHRAAHIWFVNPRGELLFQLRSPDKKSHPNMWDISAAGHIRTGESVEEGGVREALEEIGTQIDVCDLIKIAQNNSPRNKHLHTVFIVHKDLPIEAFTFNDKEVAAVKYIHWREIVKLSETEMWENKILPHKEFSDIFAYLEKNGF